MQTAICGFCKRLIKRKDEKMTENIVEKRNALGKAAIDFIKGNGIWIFIGALLELGTSDASMAVGAAALGSGLDGACALWALAGGAFGALLHGIPEGLGALAGLAIVLAARIIPNAKNAKIRAGVRFFAAWAACFFPRTAFVTKPSELLLALTAALTAGMFAACVCLLSEAVSVRGFDAMNPSERAKAAIVLGIAFVSLGALDYSVANIGRIALGAGLLLLSARRGAVWSAVFGAAGMFGLCAADAQCGRFSAVILAAAVVSGAFEKHGRITRAAAFVFASCVGALIGGYDEGGWRILTETAAAGVIYVLLPKRRKTEDEPFSDSVVAAMVRERLCFAADALAGIGTGLNAAAETLDKKYCSTLEQTAERAAERSCRTCPNSMTCWGEKYELFRGEFERLTDIMRRGEPLTEQSMSAECAQECVCPAVVIKAITHEHARRLSAAADRRRINEMRRIYIDWLAGVHDILRAMAAGSVPASHHRAAERRTESLLRECGMQNVKAFVTSAQDGRLRLEAYGKGEPCVDLDYLGGLISRALGRETERPVLTACGSKSRITAQEITRFTAKVGTFQLCKGKNRVCGDCCESFIDSQGGLCIVLSDGMGTGSRARVDSTLACSLLAKLLKSGIPLSAALETVNTSLMVKSSDESYATLDICRIDLNSGESAVYKAGASGTYIKSADRLIRAALSSPPAGSGGRLSLPAQQFTVRAGDIIVMMTDGCDVDEEWLSRELSRSGSPKELSERIARAARGAENGKNDDISVVVISVE